MTNDQSKPDRQQPDIGERTTLFAEALIDFATRIPQGAVTKPLINQLVRAGTSIGANVQEADDADSRKDFRYRLGISLREAKETLYWLRLIAKAVPDRADDARTLWREADELKRILATIRRNTKL